MLNVTLSGRVEYGGELLLARGERYAAWRAVGETAWREETGNSEKLGPIEALIELRRLADNAWEYSGMLRNAGAAAVDLARFHYFHGEVADASCELFVPSELGVGSRRFRADDTLPAPRAKIEKVWRDMHVEWPRLADPLHDQPNWATGMDVGLLLRDWQTPALVVGFTGPGTAFGEIGFGRGRFYAGVLLDGVRLEPGASRELERCVLIYGDWQEAMRFWALRCAEEFHVPPAGAPLTGYCSWYQGYEKIAPANIRRAATELAALPIPPGGRTVQLDDGFQLMPGDWRPNERFANVWDSLPAEIAATGSIPGLWLAPTTVFHSHPLVKENPDWLQRLPDGSPAVTFANWGWCDNPQWQWGDTTSPTYYLEPDHPGAREFMRQIIADAVGRGWKYLKIDFAYALSTSRMPFDRSKTSFETLRDLFRLFREAAGPDVRICACIGVMGRYALGAADIARIGGDMGDRFETVRANLPDLFVRTCTNGVWWQADPDVFHMRTVNAHLTDEENWLLTATVGLFGGPFLTSDYPSQWSDAARRLIANFWNTAGPQPPANGRVVHSGDGLPLAFRANGQVALYNWADMPRTVRVPLAALRAGAVAVSRTLPATPPLRLVGDCLICENQPPHSLRLAHLVPADSEEISRGT
jgi:hypothetical protein